MIALVTCDQGPGLDPDESATVAALAKRGLEASIVSWKAEVDWATFDLVIIRSTWDYHDHLDKFLAWVEQVSSVTTVLNPPAAIHATSNKRYLESLAAVAVPTVDTIFVDPGELLEIGFDAEEYVVKPSVSAGSNNTFRVEVSDIAAKVNHIHELGLTAMIQPYIASVDAKGEIGLVFLDGEFSHAFRKGPMLASDNTLVDGLYLAENISKAVANTSQRELADRTLAAAPRLGFDASSLLYARIDTVEVADGDYRVLEFEVIEPSLFLELDDQGVERFASAIASRVTHLSDERHDR